jgi:predicted DNA-binding transcriptional regulator AlpA
MHNNSHKKGGKRSKKKKGLRKIITKQEVLDFTGWSPPTLYRQSVAGTCPQPVELGDKQARWFEDEWIEWQENLPRRAYGDSKMDAAK